MPKSANTERDRAFQALCRRMGWRSTPQRRAVFRCLDGDTSHPEVETVWRRVKAALPDVSLDTVYRILDDFAGAGAVRRLAGGRTIRYDPDVAPHHHFRCSVCGRVFDFACAEADRVFDACGVCGAGEELFVYGACRACRREA